MNEFRRKTVTGKSLLRLAVLALPLFLAFACAPADTPDGRTVKVPPIAPPLDRYEGLNEKRDPVTRVKLGRDILVPQPLREDVMPDVVVGPYELRGETLASALQLILDEYDVSLAFESNKGLTNRITVANLHGKLKDVVNRVCALADLYCHFESDTLTIKDTETFIVDLPPIGGGGAAASSSSGTAYSQIATGLKAIIGTSPTVDESTRVMIYTATQRSHKYALQYFERLRKNTALIIFETNIWEVTLNNENRTGIDWTSAFNKLGNFSIAAVIPGVIPTGTGTPVAITPEYKNGSTSMTAKSILAFISVRGSVKTISQPQITVLSGSTATFAVQQNQNFVKSLVTTPCSPTPCTATVTPTTDTVKTGLTMSVTSAWDQSTVYGNLSISLEDLLRLQDFGGIQLPLTTTRNLQTQIRVRPGDAVLIGGLVSEKNDLEDSGPGFMTPLFATSRAATKVNTELVFLLRPRVVAFDIGDDSDTPLIVDAPKEGMALRSASVPNISDAVKDIFGSVPAVSAAAPAPPSSERNGKTVRNEKEGANK